MPIIAVPPASRGEVDKLASPNPRLVFENIDLKRLFELLEHVGGATPAHVGVALTKSVPARAANRAALALATGASGEAVRAASQPPGTRAELFAEVAGFDTRAILVAAAPLQRARARPVLVLYPQLLLLAQNGQGVLGAFELLLLVFAGAPRTKRARRTAQTARRHRRLG